MVCVKITAIIIITTWLSLGNNHGYGYKKPALMVGREQEMNGVFARRAMYTFKRLGQ